MLGLPVRAVVNLLAAGDASGSDQRVVRRRTNGRKQAHLTDLHRQIIMFTFETERTGHATAARIEHVHLSAGQLAQQAHA